MFANLVSIFSREVFCGIIARIVAGTEDDRADSQQDQKYPHRALHRKRLAKDDDAQYDRCKRF